MLWTPIIPQNPSLKKDEEIRMNKLNHEILYACTVCTAAGLGALAVVSAATLIWVFLI
jgi:hypothetical protein